MDGTTVHSLSAMTKLYATPSILALIFMSYFSKYAVEWTGNQTYSTHSIKIIGDFFYPKDCHLGLLPTWIVIFYATLIHMLDSNFHDISNAMTWRWQEIMNGEEEEHSENVEGYGGERRPDPKLSSWFFYYSVEPEEPRSTAAMALSAHCRLIRIYAQCLVGRYFSIHLPPSEIWCAIIPFKRTRLGPVVPRYIPDPRMFTCGELRC